MRFEELRARDIRNTQKNLHNNFDFSTFRFKQRNLNKNRRVKLCNRRRVITNEKRRRFETRCIHVQTNVFNEVQLRDIR